MKILVGCHCKEPFEDYDDYLDTEYLWSPKLNFINQTGKEINTDEIEYYFIDKKDTSPDCPSYDIDPNQYDNWNDIPNNSFDLVWLEHCPIGVHDSVDYEIIGNSIQKLNNNGILITETFREYKNFWKDKIKIISETIGMPVEIKYLSYKKVPYILTPDNPDDIQNLNKQLYLTIKKIQNNIKRGGTYKRKKSKRRKMKTKKRHTRY